MMVKILCLEAIAMKIIQGYRTYNGEYCPEFGYRRTLACERP